LIINWSRAFETERSSRDFPDWPVCIILINGVAAAAEKGSLYRIRPDGYIAYRNQPADKERLRHYLASVFNSGSR